MKYARPLERKNSMGVRIFRGGELDERFVGSVVVLGPRHSTMIGLVRGDLFVREKSTCDVTGLITGSLLSESTGKAILHGMVHKDVKATGGDIEIYGYVLGDVVVEKGKVFVGEAALIRGEIKGETVSEPPITGEEAQAAKAE